MQFDETYTRDLNVTIYYDVKEEEIDWLWYPYIPRGKITILQGDPGEGKTTLALHLAACLTNGTLPNGETLPKPLNVLYQSAEDGIADTILPRLKAAGANLKRIFSVNEGTEPLDLIDNRLETAMSDYMQALVILDPLQAFLGADVDMHRANEIRPVMTILAQMAARNHCAVVLIGHMNKQMGTKSLYRGLGSIDLTAAARSVLLMARDPKEQDIRVMMHIKSSLAKEGSPLAFRIGENSRLDYEGVYAEDTSNLLQADTAVSRRGKGTDAVEFLKAALADGQPHASAEIQKLAKENGIAKSTLSRARKKLGVQMYKKGEGWFCRLPAHTPAPEPLPMAEPEPLNPDEWTKLL